jgi:hypothetical protein
MHLTQRKQGEEALPESEERFRAVANSAPIMNLDVGPGQALQFFQQGLARFRGPLA